MGYERLGPIIEKGIVYAARFSVTNGEKATYMCRSNQSP